MSEFLHLVPSLKYVSLDDITYAEIEGEWPLSVQMEIVERIGEAIQPGYKETRKNS